MIALHEYEAAILKLLKERRSAGVADMEAQLRLGRDSVVWALENLADRKEVLLTKKSVHSVELTDEGRRYAKQFPEEALVAELHTGPVALDKIKDRIGLIWAKKNGWIEITKQGAKLTKEGAAQLKPGAEYGMRQVINGLGMAAGDALEGLVERNKNIVKALSDRNLIKLKERSEITNASITAEGGRAGGEAGAASAAEQGDLTHEDIASGGWKSKRYRGYDVNATTEPAYAARLHPMHELIDRIRHIWLSMGFTEVTGPIIESAFWDFDALFVPQDHPAREMQDTFFLSNPKMLDIDDVELLGRIKEMHEKGWQEEWREAVSRQALLRTHTTATTMRNLRKFVLESSGYEPVKIFSVGKVFRNESIDYKHLAELHQSDGIVIGDNLTLAHLAGILKTYYAALGMKVSVKPAYYPFVEPGLDVYYRDERLGKTIELCGSGIIRKEITRAMGTDKTVLAWGPGIERIALSLMKMDTITELYNNSVANLRNRREL